MNTPAIKAMNNKHQSGAALVIALILLVALSLMAISSMNSASLDLIMAGNEQYRSRAFVAAEAGIENALINGTYNTAIDSPSVAGSSNSDTYTYTITRPNNGEVDEPPSGYSEGSGGSGFGAVHFRITSTGASVRSTNAVNVQELYQVVKSGDSLSCDTTISTTCTLD